MGCHKNLSLFKRIGIGRLSNIYSIWSSNGCTSYLDFWKRRAKKEVSKIHFESKNILKKNIEEKKRDIEQQIEKDFTKTQKEIIDLKKNSLATIQNISENIASNIIENISGDKLNESSIKATVEDITKKSIGKYL